MIAYTVAATPCFPLRGTRSVRMRGETLHNLKIVIVGATIGRPRAGNARPYKSRMIG